MWQLTDHKAEKTDVPKTKTLKKYNFIKKQQQQNTIRDIYNTRD